MEWTIGIDPARVYQQVVVIDHRKKVIGSEKAKGLSKTCEIVNRFVALAQDAQHPVRIGIEATDTNLLDKVVQQVPNIPIYELNTQKVSVYKRTADLSGSKTDYGDAVVCAFFVMDWYQTLKPFQVRRRFEKKCRLIAHELDLTRVQKTMAWERFWAIIGIEAGEMKEAINNPDADWYVDLFQQAPTKMKHMSQTAFLRKCRKLGSQLEDEKLGILFKGLQQLDKAGYGEVLKMRARTIAVYRKEDKYWEEEARKVLGSWEKGWILLTIPGMGAKTLIRLIGYLGMDWTKLEVAKVSAYSGVAPILRGTGTPDRETLKKMPAKKRRRYEERRRHRLACHKPLKTTMCLFSLYSMGKNPWAKAAYDRFRERGQSHWEALRNLSIKWIRIFLAMMRDEKPYDQHSHQENIRKRNDPLMQKFG